MSSSSALTNRSVGCLAKVIDAASPRVGHLGVVVVDDRSSAPFKLQFEDGKDHRGNWFQRSAVEFITTASAQAGAQRILMADAKRRADKIKQFASASASASTSASSSSSSSQSSVVSRAPAPRQNAINTGASKSSASQSRAGNDTFVPVAADAPAKNENDIVARLRYIEQYLKEAKPEERALARAVVNHGGMVKAYPGLRPDGVRGLLTPAKLSPNELILCIPKSFVMHHSVARPSVRDAITATLTTSGFGSSPMERQVYEQMMALCIELMVERAIIENSGNDYPTKEDPSYWRAYVSSLPPAPSTVNMYSTADRKLYNTLLSQDLKKMYARLVDAIVMAVQQVPDFARHGATAPERETVEAEFFFILSRLSYLRLIPFIDLANAALPNEHNVKIHQDPVSGNCYLHALRHIAPGEELCIDYNHRSGVSLMASYGFSMGLEKLRTSFKLPQLQCPSFLIAYDGKNHMDPVQLLVNRSATGGLPAATLLVLRLAAMGSEQQMLEAIHACYFDEKYIDRATWPPKKATKFQRFRALEQKGTLYQTLLSFCDAKMTFFTEKIDPLLQEAGEVSSETWDESYEFQSHQTIVDQIDTDKLMLQRLRTFLLSL